jgi:hypothetical protein
MIVYVSKIKKKNVFKNINYIFYYKGVLENLIII